MNILHMICHVHSFIGWKNSYNYSGSPGFALVQKLKALKVDLHSWNKETFVDANFRRKDL